MTKRNWKAINCPQIDQFKQKELNWNASLLHIQVMILRLRTWAWDIIPDQNWIQGWRNAVFWTLPHPRELPTLSQGKLKQSGIKYNKTLSSNEVPIMNIAVYFIRSCATGQLPGCSCDKLIGKRRRQVELDLSGRVTLLHCYNVTCVLCFGGYLLCVCLLSWISLSMLHLFYVFYRLLYVFCVFVSCPCYIWVLY